MKNNNLLSPIQVNVKGNSKSSRKSRIKSNSKINTQPIKNWKDSHLILPKKGQTQKIPVTKTLQDDKNCYKYKDEPHELQKRSSLAEVSSFILSLINKSESQELSNTQKYMLSGYINIYVKEKYVLADSKDINSLTLQKLKTQWAKICNAWELYKIKFLKCRIGDNWQEKEERSLKNFQNIYNEIVKLQKKKQKKEKLEPIKKLMKKFYLQLLD